MILLNRSKIELNKFPDGTFLLKDLPINYPCSMQTITWNFENNEELVALYFITRHLQNANYNVILRMSYLPNARQDRVKSKEDCFTLKYFSEIINSLNFYKVEVLDVHSSVGEALIDRIEVIEPTEYIKKVLDMMDDWNTSPILCFPDEGSMKRYSNLFNLPYVFCIKERDWQTGEITKLSLVGATEEIKNKNILIVDDICSKGGTFLYTARELQKYNPINISLFITHCENTILEGELINSGLLKRIYTTDSIFNKEHKLINIIKL